MSKKPATASVSPTPPPAQDEKPLVLVGLEQSEKGFVVVSTVARGGRLESLQRHGPPQLKHFAAAELRRVLKAKVLFPRGQ